MSQASGNTSIGKGNNESSLSMDQTSSDAVNQIKEELTSMETEDNKPFIKKEPESPVDTKPSVFPEKGSSSGKTPQEEKKNGEKIMKQPTPSQPRSDAQVKAESSSSTTTESSSSQSSTASTSTPTPPAKVPRCKKGVLMLPLPLVWVDGGRYLLLFL